MAGLAGSQRVTHDATSPATLATLPSTVAALDRSPNDVYKLRNRLDSTAAENDCPGEVKMPSCPFLSLLLLSLALLAGCQPNLPNHNLGNDDPAKPVRARLADREAIAKLLPPDVQLETVADCEYGGTRKITVEDELIRVKACVGQDGTLQDAMGKPIHFFKLTGCWGNPPANYQELLNEQNRRLEELRKTHTVITLTCNPSGMPIP